MSYEENQNDKMQPPRVSRVKGPIQRISSEQFGVMGDVLDIYALGFNPSEQTQRRAFRKLLPHVFVLRKLHHLTFKEITVSLAKCGLKLNESTVRVYFSKMFPKYQVECELHLVAAEKNLAEFKIEFENQVKQNKFKSALAVKAAWDSDESW